MPVRTSNAEWSGSLREGNGRMSLGSGAWEGPYSFGSRFEEAGGTNPEELIGAAHAGCFSMALSGILVKEGYAPERIATAARVHLDKGGDGFTITRIELETRASVPGIDAEAFRGHAEEAKKGCPVSRALTGVDISVDARLEE
ncbi:MAG TPA: OsmC family protein [Longimicrobiales bacterium]|nr:OsmC family protein [Longimicrobiales bacterium]